MKVKFKCGGCGQNLSTDSDKAGTVAPCPKCGATVTAKKEITLGNGPTKYGIFTRKDGEVETVKWGFSWPGFFLPTIWTLINGLYWKGLILLLVGLVLTVLSRECSPGSGPWALFWLCSLMVRCIVGDASNKWRRKLLRKKGYVLTCIVHASSVTEAGNLFRKHQKVSSPPIPPINTLGMPPESSELNRNLMRSKEIGTIPVPTPPPREEQPPEPVAASYSTPRATKPLLSTPPIATQHFAPAAISDPTRKRSAGAKHIKMVVGAIIVGAGVYLCCTAYVPSHSEGGKYFDPVEERVLSNYNSGGATWQAARLSLGVSTALLGIALYVSGIRQRS